MKVGDSEMRPLINVSLTVSETNSRDEAVVVKGLQGSGDDREGFLVPGSVGYV